MLLKLSRQKNDSFTLLVHRTVEKFLAPTWGHASLPSSLMSVTYTVPRVLGFQTQTISSRPNQLRVLPSTGFKSTDCVPPYGRTYSFSNKYHYFLSCTAK